MTTVLYLGSSDGLKILRKSESDTWELEDAKMPRWAIEALAVVPSEPNVLFAATRGDGVWRSDDGGASFSKPNHGRPGPQKVMSLAVDPKNEHRIYAGCEPIDLYVSNDRGENWEQIEGLRETPYVAIVPYPAPVEPHVKHIAIDPNDTGTMYLALQIGFVLKTTDGGKSWELSDNGLDHPDVHQVAMDPNDSKHLLVTSGGALSRRNGGKAMYSSTDGGETWVARATEFRQNYGKQMLIKRDQPEVMFSGLAISAASRWTEKGADGVFLRSEDGGANWSEVDLSSIPDATQDFVVSVTQDPEDPNTLYGAFYKGGLICSTNGGDSWSKVDITVPGGEVQLLASSV